MENSDNYNTEMQNMKVRYVVKLRLGELSKGKNGWSKQANIIKWNNGLFKLDIRDWNGDKQQMRRGITLTKSEAEKLISLLKSIDMRLIDDYEIERTATVTMPVIKNMPEWPRDTGLSNDSLPVNDSTQKNIQIDEHEQDMSLSELSENIGINCEETPIIGEAQAMFTESA